MTNKYSIWWATRELNEGYAFVGGGVGGGQ